MFHFFVFFILICVLCICIKINGCSYGLPFFPSNDWSNIKTTSCFDVASSSENGNCIFSNVGSYELLVGIEGSLGLGLMLGRKEIVGAGQYIGEYTGIVKVYNKNDTSNYNANLVNGKYVIDAKDSLNILKYCNHSYKPNAYLQVCRHSDGSLRVGMFSKRSIQLFSWINICYCKGKALKGFFKESKCHCNSCIIYNNIK